MSGLLKNVATELAKCRVNIEVVEELRLKKLGTEWAADFTFFF
jgi:hypothetical protein